MHQAKMALRAHTEVVSRAVIEAMLQLLTLCFGGGIAVRVFPQLLLIYIIGRRKRAFYYVWIDFRRIIIAQVCVCKVMKNH